MDRPRLPWWKLVAVWATFLALHFSYETFPNILFKVIGEEGETVFFHMKMLFFAYVAVSLVEWFVRRRSLRSPSGFLYSRALIAVAFPWLTITVWFVAEAIGFAMPDIAIELAYANVVTVVGIYLALRLEELFDGIALRASMKAMIVVVFACAVLTYVAFSLQTPVHFFTTPPSF